MYLDVMPSSWVATVSVQMIVLVFAHFL
uniref:Uncharacterized protein n=1 Tax=Anopheles atroparvus TaxID=41427 RepID=A0AAG5D0M6_ANOAO